MCNCVRLGTDEQVAEFNSVLAEYKDRTDIMVVLQKTQGIFGYIPKESVKISFCCLNPTESTKNNFSSPKLLK